MDRKRKNLELDLILFLNLSITFLVCKREEGLLIGLLYVPHKFLTSRNSEWDFPWKLSLCKCSQVNMRSLRWVPIQNDWCLYKKGKFGHRNRHPQRNTTIWSLGECYQKPRNYQKLERSLEQTLPGAFRGSMALLTPWSQTSGLWNPETTHFSGPKSPNVVPWQGSPRKLIYSACCCPGKCKLCSVQGSLKPWGELHHPRPLVGCDLALRVVFLFSRHPEQWWEMAQSELSVNGSTSNEPACSKNYGPASQAGRG